MTRQSITLSIALFLYCNNVWGHSGISAHSYPLTDISVDGKLNDWPKNIKKYTIDNFLGTASNHKSFFQTGYDLDKGILYVAVTVMDDNNISTNSENNVFKNKEDKQVLYLDPEHSHNKGSGVIMIGASLSGMNVQKVRSAWDPYNRSFSDQNVEVEVTYDGERIVYEWAIQLRSSIQEYTSIGLDFLVSDCDGSDVPTTYSVWSQGGMKQSIPTGLGDLLLLPAKEPIGHVNGLVKWEVASNENPPSYYKIQSINKSDLWTIVKIDSTGHYSTDLPFEEYTIKPFQKVNNEYSFNDKVRINEHASVAFTVSNENSVVTDTLTLARYDSPNFLIPQKGILYENTFDPDRVNTVVSTYMEFSNVTGLSLAVIKDGELVYNNNLGYENTITQQPVADNSIFELASVSKTVFAYAINRLADKQIIDLDLPLYKYLAFDQLSEDDRAKEITARHILSHQSGLPNWAWGGPFGSERGEKTTLSFRPGTKYQYSGEGYEYLKRVIEHITDKDIETIIEEEVFQPFGMVSSSFTATPDIIDNIIVGHTENIPMFWELHDRPWISGSMYSTSSDMAVFMKALMEQKRLTQKAYDDMIEPQVINDNPWRHHFGGYQQAHSLGFEIEDTAHGRIIHHGGNNGDFQARFAMNLKNKSGFILLTNNNNGYKLDLLLQQFFFSGRLDE